MSWTQIMFMPKVEIQKKIESIKEENKMYNAKDAVESVLLPTDTIFDGTVTGIKDGKVKDFVTSEKWQGDTEVLAINVEVSLKYKDKIFNFYQLFTYKLEDGKTAYTPNSNLGRFKKKYSKLPEVGDKVKCITNTDGFLRIKVD